MKCNKCGNINNEGDLYCRQCGAKIEIPENDVLYESMDLINDDVLVDAYIKKNIDQLKHGFSWCAFLFGPCYALYRKMWLYGFLWLVIKYIANRFLTGIYYLAFFGV